MAGGEDDDALAVLEDARARGFLGPGPVVEHWRHAEAYRWALDRRPERALDLGSGGGVPGLVLALAWPDTRWTLLDAGQQRTVFLGGAVVRLGLKGRVDVVRGRAEELAHEPGLRSKFGLVVARSFGPPAVTAECGAAFLTLGGTLLVSEPPGGRARWPASGLAALGLRDEGLGCAAPAIRRLVAANPCPATYPRRTGVPSKRPLF
jgi:16S rRNA (guanine527-N7)-methyltransferase